MQQALAVPPRWVYLVHLEAQSAARLELLAVRTLQLQQRMDSPEAGMPVLVVKGTETTARVVLPMVKMTARVQKMLNLKSVDELTSHSTRPSKNASQVAGYTLFCLVGLLLPALAWAESVGTITHLGGIIRATRADGTSKLLSVKSEIMEGDTLKTEEDTFARIKFVDGGEVVLRPETVFKVDAYSYRPVAEPEHKDNILFSLIKGGLRSVTGLLGKRNPDAFKMNTAAATIGIRGTHFGALLCNNDCANIPTVSGQAPGNGLYTDTASGKTIITNAAGSIEVPAGSFSFTPGSNVAPKLVPPSQGIQVTMPPAISSNKGNGSGMGTSDSNSCTVK